MKIKIFDKAILKKYYEVFTAISVLIAFVFMFDMSTKTKLVLGVIAIVLAIAICLIVWRCANKMDKATISICGSTVEIGYGDIFQEASKKVIAFNEYYDTVVDNLIISETSLNGQYIKNIFTDVAALDKSIVDDDHLSRCTAGSETKRKAGKTKKYKLGTIHVEGDYYLLAFAHVDKDNKAYLYVKDYVVCLLNMWDEIDIFYANQTVAIPLLGSGITRFEKCENITEQELLDVLLWTFKTSKLKFKHGACLKIVLSPDIKDKINLFELNEKYDD